MGKKGTTRESELFVTILKQAEQLESETSTLLRAYGLTAQQYNVLRILRGSAPAGLTCGAVRSRMITRLPDITRLLDRLEERDLVTRSRGQKDRRVVEATITAAGASLLAAIDAPLSTLHQQQFSVLTGKEQRALHSLFQKLSGNRKT